MGGSCVRVDFFSLGVKGDTETATVQYVSNNRGWYVIEVFRPTGKKKN